MANIAAIGANSRNQEDSWVAASTRKMSNETRAKKASPPNSLFGAANTLSSIKSSPAQGSESNNLPASSTPCKFFQSGQCSKGAKCPFLHKKIPSTTTICKFFANGFCRNGDRCQFVHGTTNDDLDDEVPANENWVAQYSNNPSNVGHLSVVESEHQMYSNNEESDIATTIANGPIVIPQIRPTTSPTMQYGTPVKERGQGPSPASISLKSSLIVEEDDDDDDVSTLINESIDKNIHREPADDEDDEEEEEDPEPEAEQPVVFYGHLTNEANPVLGMPNVSSVGTSAIMNSRSRAGSFQGSFDSVLFLGQIKPASPMTHPSYFEEVFSAHPSPIWKSNPNAAQQQQPQGSSGSSNGIVFINNVYNPNVGGVERSSPLLNPTNTSPRHFTDSNLGSSSSSSSIATKAHRSNSSSSLFANDPALALLSPPTRATTFVGPATPLGPVYSNPVGTRSNPNSSRITSQSSILSRSIDEEDFDLMFQYDTDLPQHIPHQPQDYYGNDDVEERVSTATTSTASARPIMNFFSSQHQQQQAPTQSSPRTGGFHHANISPTTGNKIVFIENAINSNANIAGQSVDESSLTASVDYSADPFDMFVEDTSTDIGKTLCSFHIDGKCRYGETCRNIHGDICHLCGKPNLMPGDPSQNEKHFAQCEEKIQRQREIENSKDYECGICHEKIIENGKKFGILISCSHTYCVPCIKQWRQDRQSSECPHPKCGAVSPFIIPSPAFVGDLAKKNLLLNTYKEKMNKIPCKYFDFGKGTCKFGDNCHYAHVDPNGRPIQNPQRTFVDSSGDFQHYNELNLAMFLESKLERKRGQSISQDQ